MYETTGQALELDGPDPRARALGWHLGHLRKRWQGASEEDVQKAYRSDDPVPPAQRLRFAGSLAEKVPSLELDGVIAVSEQSIDDLLVTVASLSLRRSLEPLASHATPFNLGCGRRRCAGVLHRRDAVLA